jgi:hypothetical protein
MLINNGGVRHPAHRLTVDGLEMHSQVPIRVPESGRERAVARVVLGWHDSDRLGSCSAGVTRIGRQVNHAGHFLLTHGLLDRCVCSAAR